MKRWIGKSNIRFKDYVVLVAGDMASWVHLSPAVKSIFFKMWETSDGAWPISKEPSVYCIGTEWLLRWNDESE